MRRVYASWFAAFALKLLGSAWDVSWHFRTEYDLTSPAHVTNAIGLLLLILTLLIEWRDRTSERQGPLLVVAAGVGLFLIAIPADYVWHEKFGVDLTTWSPTHLTLFFGTVVQIGGFLLLMLADFGWRSGARLVDRDPRLTFAEWFALGAFAALFVEALAFPMGYNEYATVGAWRYVFRPESFDADLLAAVPSIADPPFAGDAHWIYPAYSILIGAFASVLFLTVSGKRGAALLPMVGYVAFRIVGAELLTAAGWPRGVIPYQFILVGLVAEFVWLLPSSHRARSVMIGAITAGISYAWFLLASRIPADIARVLTVTPWLTPAATAPNAGGAAFLAANPWIGSAMPIALPFTSDGWWLGLAAGLVGALLAVYITRRALAVVTAPRLTDFAAEGRKRWEQAREMGR